ncbi:DNA polymerase iota [Pleurostoma richardsiae]|uniref:DNA polymerase iota n=1 Tax=Pleurostoma richardsiae TaxID=41990 RepID=A0AA38S265_9PEZI|nr:DNA polymerase iota [Pleurostoma richardsiae]
MTQFRQQLSRPKQPQRNDDRVILHFDYDCFYAQVVENRQPALRALPLGIKQKSILATCNYEARRRGVKKLMLISEARKICPELVLSDGEDLSAFRDVSKRLYGLLRPYSWSGRVERLGLDEVFLDVTDLVAYNVSLLNRNDLANSFFCLSREDPEQGFPFDASALAGCVVGGMYDAQDALNDPLYVRLLLASHLARFLRLRVEEEGYTSACGVSTNKVLAKLVGNRNKPRNQTTLLTLQEGDVQSFMDTHGLRSVPGFGSRITHTLESYMLGGVAKTDTFTTGSTFTVGEARARADMSPALLEKLLGGPGSERGIGDRIWALLHGVDDSEVKPASNVPTQISIEDTYQSRGLTDLNEITRELRALAASLLRRMRVDLLEEDGAAGWRWVARPKTLRLSTRPKTTPAEGKPYNYARASRSQPLPGFVFSIAATATAAAAGNRGEDDLPAIAERLVAECLLPMFHRLNPRPEGGWHIGMINICAANMVLSGTDDGAASGRDISAMFRRQDEVLREFRVRSDDDEDDDARDPQPASPMAAATRGDKIAPAVEAVLVDDEALAPSRSDEEDEASDPEDSWDGDGSELCPRCGHYVPVFAATAHDRYHMLGD